MFERGYKFTKTSGDYTFEGTVLCVIEKLSGAIRYAVEDDRGLILIMNEGQISGK
jgi:hypothetical protein